MSPDAGDGAAGSLPMSTNGAQISFADLTPYGMANNFPFMYPITDLALLTSNTVKSSSFVILFDDIIFFAKLS